MRKYLVLLWLLCPVAVLTYHFNYGQAELAREQARERLVRIHELEQQQLAGFLGERLMRDGQDLAMQPDHRRRTGGQVQVGSPLLLHQLQDGVDTSHGGRAAP